MDPTKRDEDAIAKTHEANNLKNTHFKNAKEYMKQVSYEVPVKQLYEVVASCNFSTELEFCPVITRIRDDGIIAKNGGKAFLMQVWTKKGELAFERKLDKPVDNWNISTDKLLFHETEDSDTIHVVKLRAQSTSTLYELKLPAGTFEDEI